MKRLLLLGIVALIGVFSINAQNYSDEIFTAVEEKPEFPGGEGELMKWVANNIQYPPAAAEENAQGRVVVQFVVEKNGRIGQVKVVRSVHPELDKEAVRVTKTLPRFYPGSNNGQPVRCWMTLPIIFKLNGGEDKNVVEAPKEGKVFSVVEQPASYPGGDAELMKWVANNIQYPPAAVEENAQGRVVVKFVVEKDGRVGEVKVVRGKHPDLDKEAVRVVKSIKTRFIPGKNNGQPVRHWFTLPINFKLCGDEEKEPQTQQ